MSTYIIIALIPIVIGVTFYTYTLRAVSENECEKTSALLSQSVSAMDADFRMARDIMSRFMQSSALNELLVSDSPSSKPSVTMNSMEFCKELKQIYIDDSLIYDVLVYLNAPDVLYGARLNLSDMAHLLLSIALCVISYHLRARLASAFRRSHAQVEPRVLRPRPNHYKEYIGRKAL